MNPPSVDIVKLLEDESALGLVFSENLFIGMEPTTPPNCVTVFDTYGRPPQLTMDSQMYEYPSIQIRVRNIEYGIGWSLAYDIMSLLHGRAQEYVNGTLYTVIYCSSGPALLDWDANKRPRFIINFNLQRR